jgi:hypothetical protein
MKGNVVPSGTNAAVLGPTNSLEDLLTRTRAHLSAKPDWSRQKVIKRMADLGWTANVIADSLNKRRDLVLLSELVENAAQFQIHLDERTKFSPARKGTMRSLRNRLIRFAREFGLLHESFQIGDEWSQIRMAVNCVPGGKAIVKDAVRIQRRPSEYSDADLNAWAEERKKQSCSYVYVQQAQSYFRAAIRGSGLERELPLLNCCRRSRPEYRISIAKFPRKLRDELEEIIGCVNKKHLQKRALTSH